MAPRMDRPVRGRAARGDQHPQTGDSSALCEALHKDKLVSEIAAWQRKRNADNAKLKWMFTTEKAREKSRKAYPLNES